MASQKQVRAAANARAAIGNQAALVKGSAAAKERMAALRAMRGGPRKNLASVRAAKAAFTRFYNKRSYKRPSARKAAMTRDLCSANKPVIQDRRYLRSPHRYDYPGGIGSNCPKATLYKEVREPLPPLKLPLGQPRVQLPPRPGRQGKTPRDHKLSNL